MTLARRAITAALALLAAAMVFSPLVAALAGTGLDAPAVAEAYRHAGKPLAASAGVAGVAALVALALGVPFAVLVDRARPAIRRAGWAMALTTLIVPPYIVAESAIVLLGPAGTVSRGLALAAGLGPPAGDVVGRARFEVPGYVFTWPVAGAVLGGCLFPIVALAAAAASRRTDRRVFEAALLAQGRLGVLAVATRALGPPAAGASLLVLAIALTESVVPQLLRVPTLGEAVYERIQEGDLSTAAALGLSLLPAVLLAGGAGAFALVRSRAASFAGLEGEVPRFDPRAGGGGTARDIGAAVATAVAVAPGLLLPAVSLTWLSLTAALPEATPGTHQVLRASGFASALREALDLARDDAVRTVWLAGLTATLATALSVALARPLARSRRAAWLGLLGAGLAVPAAVIGLGLIVLWNRDGPAAAVYGSSAVVVLGWLARFLPVTVLLTVAALARVPAELEEAATLAGRGPARRFVAVVLPAAAPGLAAAWLATYVLSATEYAATLLVSPPGAPLLAPSVVNLMRRGQDPEIAACQVLLLAVVGLPLALLAGGLALRSGGRRRRLKRRSA